MLKRIIQFIKAAGAKSENKSDRDGFLSYHAESHAVAVGLGAGFLFIATGEKALLGIVLPVITSALRGKNKEYSKILTDVYQEPHYAIIAVVVGYLLGTTL